MTDKETEKAVEAYRVEFSDKHPGEVYSIKEVFLAGAAYQSERDRARIEALEAEIKRWEDEDSHEAMSCHIKNEEVDKLKARVNELEEKAWKYDELCK